MCGFKDRESVVYISKPLEQRAMSATTGSGSSSPWTMPIIVINMGGEMVYILQQRLQAQKVQDDKAIKVLQDVIRAMYSPLFITELFKPQDMYSAVSTKQIFEKLAHSSIMRLNKQSMEKLYDLMIMGFKYQLVSCHFPQQILQITLYHLEIIKSLVKSDTISKSVQSVISQTINLYSSLTNGQWNYLSHSLMKFLQGKKTKVSLFLQRNLQGMDGTLNLSNDGPLPLGTSVPGTITYYENGEVIKNRSFPTDNASYANVVEADEMFDLSSTLGQNMYIPNANPPSGGPSFASITAAGREMGSSIVSARKMNSAGGAQAKGGSGNFTLPSDMKSTAKAELNLLADLLGISHSSSAKEGMESDVKPFKVNLFPDNSFDDKYEGKKSSASEEGGSGSAGYILIDIDGTCGAKTFQEYLNDLKLQDDDDDKDTKGHADRKGADDDDDDLLALMDSAGAKGSRK
jgi:hypothetical protein